MTIALPDQHVAITSPGAFAHYASGGRWQFARHLELFDDYLLRLARREIKRLMVFMPPRHGKTELARFFTAWYEGVNPDDPVIMTSYQQEIARDSGRAVRDLIDAHGPELWGITTRGDADAAHDWLIQDHRGGMRSAGVGGAITGRGAKLFIVDDAVKDASEAWSPAIQERNWNWWNSTAYTRLEPGAVILFIMTRWHENDLAGRILAESTEPWSVLNLPAIAEGMDELNRKPGQALWPERWPIQELKRIQENVHEYYWRAMYQQQPSVPSGMLFFDVDGIRRGEAMARIPEQVIDTRSSEDGPITGHIYIWERPLAGARYVVGADPAEGKGEDVDILGAGAAPGSEIGGPDFNAAAIYRVPDMVQVAAIHGRQEPHEFATVLDRYGRWYNDALLAVERNRPSVIEVLRNLRYPNLYSTQISNATLRLIPPEAPGTWRYGWLTDKTTRPILLDGLRDAIRAGAIGARDAGFWAEARSFTIRDGGSPIPGHHDDRIFAHGIAWATRERARGASRNGASLPVTISI